MSPEARQLRLDVLACVQCADAGLMCAAHAACWNAICSPPPAPLRPARELAEEVAHRLALEAEGWFFDTDEDAIRFHAQATEAIATALAYDRAARPDVAALRTLLEEGADVAEMAFAAPTLQRLDLIRDWAHRAREAIGPAAQVFNQPTAPGKTEPAWEVLDARHLAAVRERIEHESWSDGTTVALDDAAFLIAEVDRLRAELAAAKDETFAARSCRREAEAGTKATMEDMGRLRAELKEARRQVTFLTGENHRERARAEKAEAEAAQMRGELESRRAQSIADAASILKAEAALAQAQSDIAGLKRLLEAEVRAAAASVKREDVVRWIARNYGSAGGIGRRFAQDFPARDIATMDGTGCGD